MTYWCWSRRDVEVTALRSTIVNPNYVDDYELKDQIFQQILSINYRFNGSHFQCDSDEVWNDSWFKIDTDSISPCITSSSLPVNVKYQAHDNSL